MQGQNAPGSTAALDFQLEIDLLALEYLLYHAIQAQLKVMRSGHLSATDGRDDTGQVNDLELKALRLLRLFEGELQQPKKFAFMQSTNRVSIASRTY